MGEGRATTGSHFPHKHVLDWRVLVLDKHGLWGRRIRRAIKILVVDLNSILYNPSNCGLRDPRKHLGKTYLVRRHTGPWNPGGGFEKLPGPPRGQRKRGLRWLMGEKFTSGIDSRRPLGTCEVLEGPVP